MASRCAIWSGKPTTAGSSKATSPRRCSTANTCASHRLRILTRAMSKPYIASKKMSSLTWNRSPAGATSSPKRTPTNSTSTSCAPTLTKTISAPGRSSSGSLLARPSNFACFHRSSWITTSMTPGDTMSLGFPSCRESARARRGCLDFGASGCLHSLVLRTKNRRRKARRASAEKSGAECAKEMRATTHAIKKPMESAEGKVIIVGVTGASGAVLAQTTLRMLDADPRVARIHLVVTETGIRLLEHELHISGPFAELPDRILDSSGAKSQRKIEILPNTDVGASIASGSYAADSMCVIPCSMGTLAAIAGGASNDLISRAADVTLKEGRRLVLCVRDTPFNRIHLENMLRAQQAGAVIMPAIPSFYHHPQTIDDLLTQYVCRVLVQLGLPQNRQFAWKGQPLRKAFKI